MLESLGVGPYKGMGDLRTLPHCAGVEGQEVFSIYITREDLSRL